MSSFIVSSLPAYVEQNRDVILKNVLLLGGTTRKYMSIMTGVKGNAALNFLELNPTIQVGSCGFTPQGSAVFSQGQIDTADVKINMEFCPADLLGKYTEHLVRISATGQELPFEQKIVEGLIESINSQIERLIWMGDDDIRVSGLLSARLGVQADESNDAYTAVMNVFNTMSENALSRKPIILVDYATHRAFVQSLIAKNYYHFDPSANGDEVFIPGTNVRVVKATPSLDAEGRHAIVGTFEGNLVYATDLEGSSEDVKLWYSEDNDTFRLRVKWNMGVGVYFNYDVVTGIWAPAAE